MQLVRISRLLILAAALAGGATVASAKTSYVPIQFRTTSGIRPYVSVQLGQTSFLMMLHLNAGFTMMTTHENARKAGVAGMAHQDTYGITAPGHLSDLGRERAVLPRLSVAGKVFADEPILVFEIPQDPPVDGMLGRDWLRNARAIVDYDQGRLGVPNSTADSYVEDRGMIAEGYIPHKLRVDPATGSYMIAGSIDGHAVTMKLSTVAANIVDIAVAREANLAVGPEIDNFGGPKGSFGSVHIAKRMLDFAVDGQRVVQDRPHILDMYAYDSERRPSVEDDDHKVLLGADFMLANRAVIDFGTNTLFLRPLSVTQPSTGR